MATLNISPIPSMRFFRSGHTQSFQRTRWRDGRVWVWLGVRKKTGRGEMSSGLAFDRIVTKPQP